MVNAKTIVISLVVVVVIVLFVGSVAKRLLSRQYLSEVVLLENANMGPEWREIGDNSTLRIEKENHYISIQLAPPFVADTPAGGIRTPDGRIMNPEIILVDDMGNSYPLNFAGSRSSGRSNFVNYRYRQEFPSGIVFTKVRIRSSDSLSVKKIIWTGYDNKDLP